MRIVVSAKAFVPEYGGTINYARMLARAFHEDGHEVTVVTRTADGPCEVDGVAVLRCPSWIQKVRLARHTDILLQVESSWQDALPFLIHGARWFPTIHRGIDFSVRSSFSKAVNLFAEKIAFRLGNTIGVSSYALNTWGIRGLCIGSSYEDEIFQNRNQSGVRDIDIFFISRMTYDKGAIVLLEAIEILCTTTPGLIKNIFLAGTGPALEEVQTRCRDLESRYGIKATAPGPVATSEEVAILLNQTKVLVFPTTSKWLEASPIVPLEGLACGCRIVASDIGGTRENIGPRGVLVSPDDSRELAEKIRISLTKPREDDQHLVEEFLAPRKVKPTAQRYLEVFSSHKFDKS